MVTLVSLISIIFDIYKALLIVRIVLTWIPHNRYHYLVTKIYEATDPYLNLFRSLNLNFSGIDFSPIVAFFVLGIVQNILIKLLLF